ncbi:MAG: hypothetical protein ACXACX_06595 [Candidatus Hodarchaeales archaeon]
MTKSSRLRLFIGTIITGLIAGGVVTVLYIFYILGAFYFVFSQSVYASAFPFLILTALFFVGIIIVTYLLIPLSLFPTVLLIETDKGYIECIKRSYQLLPGWKIKLKYMFLVFLVTYIINFVIQFVMGILLYILFFFGIFFAFSFHLDFFGVGFLLIGGLLLFLI